MIVVFILLGVYLIASLTKVLVLKKINGNTMNAWIPVYGEYQIFKEVWEENAFKTAAYYALGMILAVVLATCLQSRILALLGIPCLIAEIHLCAVLYSKIINKIAVAM